MVIELTISGHGTIIVGHGINYLWLWKRLLVVMETTIGGHGNNYWWSWKQLLMVMEGYNGGH